MLQVKHHIYVWLSSSPPRAPRAPPRAAPTTTTAVPIHKRVVYMCGICKFTTWNMTVLCRYQFGHNLFQHTTAKIARIMHCLSQHGCPSEHGSGTLISGKTRLSIAGLQCVRVRQARQGMRRRKTTISPGVMVALNRLSICGSWCGDPYSPHQVYYMLVCDDLCLGVGRVSHYRKQCWLTRDVAAQWLSGIILLYRWLAGV